MTWEEKNLDIPGTLGPKVDDGQADRKAQLSFYEGKLYALEVQTLLVGGYTTHPKNHGNLRGPPKATPTQEIRIRP